MAKYITVTASAFYDLSSKPADYTLINNNTIGDNPSAHTPSAKNIALGMQGKNGVTLVNNGTINSTYATTGGTYSYGIHYVNNSTSGPHLSITNATTGVIEATNGTGYGISMAGGTVVNAGLISGHFNGSTGYHANAIQIVEFDGFVTNATTGIITGGGIFLAATGTIVNAGTIQGGTGSGSYGGIFLKDYYGKGGGSITNLKTGTISAVNGAYGVKIGGLGGTVTNAGYIDGGSSSHDAVLLAIGGTNRVIVDPGAKFRGFVDAGSATHSTLELGSGASQGVLNGFGAEYLNFGTIAFDASSNWLLKSSAAAISGLPINGFAPGETIDLTDFTAMKTGTLTGGTNLTLTTSGGAHTTLSFGAALGDFVVTTGAFGTEITTICFCAGTLIDTPNGAVPVEHLCAGDTVHTAHNGPRAVKWVGNGKVLATRGQRSAATPVIVRRGALADNVPNRDLRVTKAHSLYIDDVLIPVEFLVNHKTILWDDRAQEVAIYHVELDSHDLLIANGAPAESYRDDGNRWLFQNANDGWDGAPQEPYTPVLTGGPLVDAVWRRLLDRAGRRGSLPLTEDPDLHLLVDGIRVDARERRGRIYVFRLPHRPASVVIASRSGAPDELGLGRDPRALGVALRQVAIRQGAKFMLIDPDDARLTTGFHDYEPSNLLRWTDGRGELPVADFARFDRGAEVMLHLGGATQYLDEGDRVAHAAA